MTQTTLFHCECDTNCSGQTGDPCACICHSIIQQGGEIANLDQLEYFQERLNSFGETIDKRLNRIHIMLNKIAYKLGAPMTGIDD